MNAAFDQRRRCSACHATNLGPQTVCVVCGGPLKRICGSCGAPAQFDADRCAQCGNGLTIMFKPPGWLASHRAPAEGMAAWSSPDPSVAPAAMLPGSLNVQLVEERGAWASILCDNGWTGWVDGRLLQRVE
jgi:hypothetical protein